MLCFMQLLSLIAEGTAIFFLFFLLFLCFSCASVSFDVPNLVTRSGLIHWPFLDFQIRLHSSPVLVQNLSCLGFFYYYEFIFP
ncbi:hypothetical protein NC651_026266 [Populus alba x Populus x berolinensis]|nr:hypothetical protein NC651_026266 [Populus alba x Populus x berolinensis]